MSNCYLKISPEEDEALNLSLIAQQGWFRAINDYCIDCNKDQCRYFVDIELTTRQAILDEFCVRGPSDYLRDLLNADALFRGEYCAVHVRAKERLSSLRDYIEYPPNGRSQDDELVKEATRKLAVLIAFMKKHLMWEEL